MLDSIIVILWCLFNYVVVQEVPMPSFGVRDLTGPGVENYNQDSYLQNGGAPEEEVQESIQDFMKRQIDAERGQQIRHSYDTQRTRNFDMDSRVPGPPGMDDVPRQPSMQNFPPGYGSPSVPGPPGMDNVRRQPSMQNIPPGYGSAPYYIGGRYRPGSPMDSPAPNDWYDRPTFFPKQDLPPPERMGRTLLRPNYPETDNSPSQTGEWPSPLREMRGKFSGTKQEAAEEIKQLPARLSATGRWPEFYKMSEDMRKLREGKPPENKDEDFFAVAEYSRSLLSNMPKQEIETTTTQRPGPSYRYAPNPGMDPYWNPDGKPKPATPKPVARGKIPIPMMQTDVARNIALRKLAEFEQWEKTSLNPRALDATSGLPLNGISVTALEITTVAYQNVANITRKPVMPMFDDFHTPIIWVPVTSKQTSDGLAKVTDPKTGRNRQYVVNGEVMVPVIDYSLERLGLTSTTTFKPAPTKDVAALRTIIDTIDLKNADQRDWLAFEVAIGGRGYPNKCYTDGCGARCGRLGCESQCSGDTCSTGCVGASCSTMCSGPGCLSMCIGESCSAACKGMSCEARCLGKSCEAHCRSFSCRKITNGVKDLGGGTFQQHYPEYSETPREPRDNYEDAYSNY